jgi:holliday junction DNA helicase RuvA
MIASLSGVVKAISPATVVIEVGGVGMLVQISPRHASTMQVGKSVSLFTTLLVREDALTLYGFESAEDRILFDLLQTVTGIGPKVAQSALNIYESPQLINAIFGADAALLEKIPGLGKKGAQRLILELKEKVVPTNSSHPLVRSSWKDELIDALVTLGFSAKESADVVESVASENPQADSLSREVLLKQALQMRGRRS